MVAPALERPPLRDIAAHDVCVIVVANPDEL
jgi:hypothetical protein